MRLARSRRQLALWVAGAACGATALAAVAVGPLSRTDDPGYQLEHRRFEGTALTVDGVVQSTRISSDHSLAFASDKKFVTVVNRCADFGSDYHIADGRLVLDGGIWEGGAFDAPVGESLGSCSSGPAAELAQRMEQFYLAGPEITVSGTTLELRGSGIDLVLAEAAFPA